MLRQRAVPLLLAFLLLLSQHMGLAHVVSHLSSDPTSSASPGKHLPNEMQCEQCLAFSAIGSALPGTPPVVFVDLSAQRIVVDVPLANFLPRAIRAFDSRAPPSSIL